MGATTDLRESLRQLRTDHIDIYIVHHIQWRTELDSVLARRGALESLLEAKSNGTVGFIGISGHDPEILCEAISTGYFDVVELPHNALDHAIFQPIVDLALRLDVGVLTMKALAAGRLADSKERVATALRFALCVRGVAKCDCRTEYN